MTVIGPYSASTRFRNAKRQIGGCAMWARAPRRSEGGAFNHRTIEDCAKPIEGARPRVRFERWQGRHVDQMAPIATLRPIWWRSRRTDIRADRPIPGDCAGLARGDQRLYGH